MTLRESIFTTSEPASVILVRLVVSAVFLSEGIQINFDPSNLPDDATTLIAEGALKADALSALRPE